MKKIMVLAMSALLMGSMSVSAMAAGHGTEFVRGGHGGFHTSHFSGGHFNHGYAGNRYGHFHGGYGGYYGGDDDDFVGPLIAGGVIGAVLGNVLNR